MRSYGNSILSQLKIYRVCFFILPFAFIVPILFGCMESGPAPHVVNGLGSSSLDKTFNTNGIAVSNGRASGNGDIDYGMAITTDLNQKILVGGFGLNSSGNTYMAVWRYNNDGRLDTSFGTNGIAINSNAARGNGGIGTSIAIDSNQNILVTGGSVNSSGNYDMTILRYTSNGTLDTSFGANGIAISSNSAGGIGGSSGMSIKTDSNQRILVAGGATNSSGDYDMVIWRYNNNGTLDKSFGTNGIVLSNGAAGGSAGSDYGASVAIDSSQKILVTGSSTNSSGRYAMVTWRYNSDGTLDTSFGRNGVVVSNGAAGGIGNEFGTAIAIDATQKIVVTGSSTNKFGINDMVIWRYDSNGTLDTSFGSNGIAVSEAAAGAGSNSLGKSITVQSNGEILVAGYGTTTTGTNSASAQNMLIWRYNSTGLVDGFVNLNSAAGSAGTDSGNSITSDSSGKIHVTGSTNSAGHPNMTIWAFNN